MVEQKGGWFTLRFILAPFLLTAVARQEVEEMRFGSISVLTFAVR